MPQTINLKCQCGHELSADRNPEDGLWDWLEETSWGVEEAADGIWDEMDAHSEENGCGENYVLTAELSNDNTYRLQNWLHDQYSEGGYRRYEGDV